MKYTNLVQSQDSAPHIPFVNMMVSPAATFYAAPIRQTAIAPEPVPYREEVGENGISINQPLSEFNANPQVGDNLFRRTGF
jgi:hypothetical protein